MAAVTALLLVLTGLVLSLSSASVQIDDHDDKRGRVEKLPMVWPLPRHFRSGSGGRKHTRSLTVAHHLQFWCVIAGTESANIVVKGAATSCSSSPILDEAFRRYHDLIFSTHKGQTAGHRLALSTLIVEVQSSEETLRYGADESYSLAVPDPANSTRAYIQANTVFGALRGLETFSQLCSFDFKSRSVQVRNSPWFISDEPRFPYRGLLIDTARHYQPPRVIKKVIDAMAYAKLNVLHWHIVDTQSFPLEIPSYPKLWEGSYTIMERYTIEDAKDIVEYARKRGINVMAELDVPGHARSWGLGYPQLWPSGNCTQPLDVSRNFTFRLINGIISDFSKVFPFDFVHMGGDEVNTSCWTETPRINKWLRKNNLTGFDAYKNFVLQAEAISLLHGYTPVNWEEPFDNFGPQLNKKTVIHNWLQAGVAPKVVKAGFRCIVSDQDVWYLDHLNVTWQQFYMNEPLINITEAREQALVIGGEVCMWGETVDASDIEQTIWPRAAAAAERLWSSLDRIAKEPGHALPRLRYFRCLLNQRGVAAAPVSGNGRAPPIGPDSCYAQ